MSEPVPNPASQPDTTDRLFSTILGFTPPFYLIGSGGDRAAANMAIAEPVAPCTAATRPMPQPHPAPVAPPSPAPPPRDMPPAQPKAAANPVSPARDGAEFPDDIETMIRDAHTMGADPQTRAEQSGLESPEASIAWMELQRNHGGPPAGHAAL